jgi:hypothetical protein
MTSYNIRDYGAVGDGATNEAMAIQAAIDACAAGGGGTVLVPAGATCRSGALVLRSNVELHIERGARLLASDDYADYPAELDSFGISGGLIDEGELPRRAFIISYRADNIAISGGGTIDGNGRAFVGEDLGHIYQMAGERQYLERPFTIFLIGGRNITMRDVTVHDAAFWTVRVAGCDDVLIHGVRVDNDLKLPNNDAIDIDCCRNVRISDCHIVSGDDAICLKTCRAMVEAGFGGIDGVIVTGCILMSTSSALKIGNEVMAPIRNVVFDSCVVLSSHRGLAIALSQAADVENIIFSNMVVETRLFHEAWWGRGEPIYVAAIPWLDQVGHIRHVRFTNVLCRSENGVLLQGWAPGLIEDVTFEGVRVELDKWSRWPGGRHDIRPCPGDGLPARATAGFFLQEASDVALRNCTVVWGACRPAYFRHALEAHRVAGLRNEGFCGQAAHPQRDSAVIID